MDVIHCVDSVQNEALFSGGVLFFAAHLNASFKSGVLSSKYNIEI